jgi:hypothetical protein
MVPEAPRNGWAIARLFASKQAAARLRECSEESSPLPPIARKRLSQSLPSLASTSPNRGFSGPSSVSLLSFSSADPSCCPGLLSDGLLFPRPVRPSTLGRLSGLMNSLASTEEEPVNSGGLNTRFAFPNR